MGAVYLRRWEGAAVTPAVYSRFIACQTCHVVSTLTYYLDSPSGAWIVRPTTAIREDARIYYNK